MKSNILKCGLPFLKAWARQFSTTWPLDFTELRTNLAALSMGLFWDTLKEKHDVSASMYMNSLYTFLFFGSSLVFLAQWYGIQLLIQRSRVPVPNRLISFATYMNQHDLVCFLTSTLVWNVKEISKISLSFLPKMSFNLFYIAEFPAFIWKYSEPVSLWSIRQ